MRTSFPSLPVRTVTLTRDLPEIAADGTPAQTSIHLDLRPYPAGYPQFLLQVYPPPMRFENGAAVPDQNHAAGHQLRLSVLLLARCLGDQLDASPPAGIAGREAWDAYAVAVLTELTAANLVQGDLDTLFAEMGRVNRGAGRLGKVNS